MGSRTNDMEHRVAISVSESVIRSATLRFWRRYTGWTAWAAWLVVAGWLCFALVQGDRSWLVGAAGALVLLLPSVWIFVYLVMLQRAYRRLRQMSSSTVEYVFSDQSIRSSSDLGSAEIPWSGVTRFWQFPEIWLLFVGERTYIYLPTDQLDASSRAFILDQIKMRGLRSV